MKKNYLLPIFSFLLMTGAITVCATIQKSKDKIEAYQIDIIVFRQSVLPPSDAELWQPYQPVNRDNAIILQTTNLPSSEYQDSILEQDKTLIEAKQSDYYCQLSEQDFLLAKEAKKLTYSNQYQVVTELSWIQPANGEQPVYISAGQNYDQDKHTYELSGTIALTQSAYRYLNLEMHLLLAEISNKDSSLAGINMNENRRILPDQLNYVDNPAFGLLIKAHPITSQEQIT